MIVFAVLLLIVIMVLLLNFKNESNNQLRRLENEIWELKKLLQQPVEPAKPPVEEVKPVIPTPQKKDYWETGFEVVKEAPPSFEKEESLADETLLEEKIVSVQPKTTESEEETISSPVFPLQP